MTATDHTRHSSLREGLLEHLFAGQVMAALWRSGCRDFELLRATTDSAGYDLVMEARGVLRHVQLKSSFRGARTATQKIHTALSAKPSGCVVWLCFDAETLVLGPFLWLGDAPGRPLPDLGDRVARHTKGNAAGRKAERPDLRVIGKARFEVVETVEDLAERLFGPPIRV